MKRPFLFLFIACLGATEAGAQVLASERSERGFADPVLGRWDLTVEGADGAYPSWLEVQLRTEWELMARFVGRFGSVRNVSDIRYDEGALEFRVPVQYEENAEPLVFRGRLDGETLRGTTEAADGRTLAFTGVRAPLLVREGAARWGNAIELFDGESTAGWRPRQPGMDGCWRVADGLLVATPPCVDLVSERRFDDFRLRVELRYPEGSNSGLYLRGRYEVQIQDDRGYAPDPLRIGGVYGFLRPAWNAARPAGEWQVYDVTLRGRRITVVLNGDTVIDDQVVPGITGGALDSDEGAPGPLMLQGDHGPIEFRRIELTPAVD